jgi:hypothetical protein
LLDPSAMSRECWSCGSRRGETPFPAVRIKGLPVLCLDCAIEWASEVTRPDRCRVHAGRIRAEGIVRRAMWSARRRGAQVRAQRDLVLELQVGLL